MNFNNEFLFYNPPLPHSTANKNDSLTSLMKILIRLVPICPFSTQCMSRFKNRNVYFLRYDKIIIWWIIHWNISIVLLYFDFPLFYDKVEER